MQEIASDSSFDASAMGVGPHPRGSLLHNTFRQSPGVVEEIRTAPFGH